jgi:hypothetical protein
MKFKPNKFEFDLNLNYKKNRIGKLILILKHLALAQ